MCHFLAHLQLLPDHKDAFAEQILRNDCKLFFCNSDAVCVQVAVFNMLSVQMHIDISLDSFYPFSSSNLLTPWSMC